MFCEGVKYWFTSLKWKSMYNCFLKAFFCIFFYSVSHCSYKPTITIIDWSFILSVGKCTKISRESNIYFFPLYIWCMLYFHSHYFKGQVFVCRCRRPKSQQPSAVVMWDRLLIVVGECKETIQYHLDDDSILVPELDGVRIISGTHHELLQEVPG